MPCKAAVCEGSTGEPSVVSCACTDATEYVLWYICLFMTLCMFSCRHVLKPHSNTNVHRVSSANL